MKAQNIDEVRRQAYEAGLTRGLSIGFISGQKEMRGRAVSELFRKCRPEAAYIVEWLGTVDERSVATADWRWSARRLLHTVKAMIRG